MLTAVNRDLGSGELGFLHDAAYTGGLDLYHSWKQKTWFVSFKIRFSAPSTGAPKPSSGPRRPR